MKPIKQQTSHIKAYDYGCVWHCGRLSQSRLPHPLLPSVCLTHLSTFVADFLTEDYKLRASQHISATAK